jgi:CRISPR/Cas system-associated exonuclease Cas4 (RecB family)
MPARDQYHDAVRTALEKEGWNITEDPYYLGFGRDIIAIDLAAERTIAAERDNQKIAVEIKSFSNPSILHDFHAALGQYLNYQMAIEISEPNRILYLAIPNTAYARILERDLVQAALKRHSVRILVYNKDQEVIEVWT